jgi:hypothetical protein
MNLPPRLPAIGKNAKLIEHINRIRDAVAQSDLRTGPGVRIRRGSDGQILETDSRPSKSGSVPRWG